MEKAIFYSSFHDLQVLLKENILLTKAEEKRVDTHCIDAEEPVCNQVGANDDCLQKTNHNKPPNFFQHQCGSINTSQKPSLLSKSEDFNVSSVFLPKIITAVDRDHRFKTLHSNM